AALCLALRGGAVTLVERSKSFAEVGAGIQLAPNATRILRHVGVLEKIEPVAVRPRRLVLADAIEGRELTSLELTDFPSRYGGPYLVLHRNDLLGALLEGVRAQRRETAHRRPRDRAGGHRQRRDGGLRRRP